VLATVVRLLELSLIRVGNTEYARENESFGLTTLRNKHVRINGSTLQFHFRGKAGKQHDVDIRDRRLAKIVKACHDLPGQELFQYLSEEDKRQPVTSEDVNQYLREISGQDFTAKDFRTWAGTVFAAMALRECGPCASQKESKSNVIRAIESVANRLGNTVAVCRKCYIHPEVLQAYNEGVLLEALPGSRPRSRFSYIGLHPDERAVLRFLHHRYASAKLHASLKTHRRATRNERRISRRNQTATLLSSRQQQQ
jgi:DNA topoisomerase-1